MARIYDWLNDQIRNPKIFGSRLNDEFDGILCAPPQGRLTLVTATPVITSTQSAKTTLYYTSYIGDQIPLYDSTKFVRTTFPELSIALNDTTKNPAAIGASKVNDWFVWGDAGTVRLTHGPDWTSDTARSAGTALVMVNGILLNNAAITNGPAAQRGTYVGTTRSNASSQLDYIFGAIASGGTAGWFGVWNAYNRRLTSSFTGDSTDSWTYNSATIRASNNSSTMRCSYVSGLAEDAIVAVATMAFLGTAGGDTGYVGIGYDATNAFNGTISPGINSPLFGGGSAKFSTTSLGWHFMSMNERNVSTGTVTYYGDAGLGLQTGLFLDIWN